MVYVREIRGVVSTYTFLHQFETARVCVCLGFSLRFRTTEIYINGWMDVRHMDSTRLQTRRAGHFLKRPYHLLTIGHNWRACFRGWKRPLMDNIMPGL